MGVAEQFVHERAVGVIVFYEFWERVAQVVLFPVALFLYVQCRPVAEAGGVGLFGVEGVEQYVCELDVMFQHVSESVSVVAPPAEVGIVYVLVLV